MKEKGQAFILAVLYKESILQGNQINRRLGEFSLHRSNPGNKQKNGRITTANVFLTFNEFVNLSGDGY